MNETCVFCKKNHLPIHQIFDEIISNDNLESKKIIYFMKIIEDELKQNHWNEVFCMVNTIDKIYRMPKNTIEINFLMTLRSIRNCMISEPKLCKIQKNMKNLTMKIKNIIQIQDMQNKITPNSFDDEADRLKEILTKLNSGSDIEIQLKNYLLYRVISFFEFKVVHAITSAIDLGNMGNITYGKKLLEDDRKIQRKINEFTILILQQIIYEKKINFKLNVNADFMSLVNKIIEIKDSKLKEYFQTHQNGNWLEFFNDLKHNRNKLTHDFQDTKYSINDLDMILKLVLIFCYSYPLILDIARIIIVFSNENGFNGKINDNEMIVNKFEKLDLLSDLDAKIIDRNRVLDLFYSEFNRDTYKKIKLLKEKEEEEHFQQNKQNGTVVEYYQDKGYGFILKKDNNKLFYHVSNTKETVSIGDLVEFVIGPGRDGRDAATHVIKMT